MKIGRSRDNCSYTDRERLISRRKEDIMNKYIMIDENNRNAWEKLKEWTLEELKEFFTTDTPEYSNVEKMKDVKDIDDLKELLAEEYNGMEVPYKFEKIEK